MRSKTGSDHEHGVRTLVPVLSSDAALCEGLQGSRLLRHCLVLRVPDWPVVRSLLPAADACVIDLRASESDEWLLPLYRLVADHGDCSFVGLSSVDIPRRSRPSGMITVRWRDDPVCVSVAVGQAAIRGWTQRMRRRVIGAAALPYTVRLGLIEALSMDSGRPTSLEQIAERIGVSRSHLSRESTRVGIRIREVSDAWWVVRALSHRWVTDASWERVAWWCGFASMSGLSDLFLRGTGRRIRAVGADHPQRWFRWFEAEILSHVLASNDAA